MAPATHDIAGRCAVLHPARSHARTAVRAGRDPRSTPSCCPGGRCSTQVRAAPVEARACGRDASRGDLADRDTATTRACRPRDHMQSPARDRQHRDHPGRARPARTDDPCKPTARVRAITPHSVSSHAAQPVRPRFHRGLMASRPTQSRRGLRSTGSRPPAPR